MIVDIWKDGAWRRVRCLRDEPPVVVIEAENNGVPFSVAAPYANIAVVDVDRKYRCGGDWEIVRGDLIRVLGGHSETVEIFRGEVGIERDWDRRNDVVRFRAVGFIGGLKDVCAGKIGITGGVESEYPVGAESGLTYLYRYVKNLTDEDGIGWEYVCWPYKYETEWADHPSNRLGYRQTYIFDSRVKFGVLEEALGQEYEQVERGVFRRQVTGGAPVQTPVADVVSSLVEQLNLHSPGYTLVWDPGSISGDLSIQVNGQIYGDIDLLAGEIGGSQRVLSVGWKTSDGKPYDPSIDGQTIDGPVHVIEVIGKSTTQDRGTYTLNHNRESAWRLGYRKQTLRVWQNIEDLNYERRASFLSGNTLVFYHLWSWITQEPGTANNRGRWTRDYLFEWVVINALNRTIIRHDRRSHSQVVSEFDAGNEQTAEAPAPYKTVTFDETTWDFSDISTDENGLAVRELMYDNARYFLFDGLLYVSGNLAIEALAFDFRDATIMEILKECSILTNSIFYIDSQQQIHLVSRDYALTEYVLKYTLSVERTVASYWAKRTPRLHSQIVSNDDHLAAIAKYYSTQFALEEDTWKITVPETDEIAGIGLFDTVSFNDRSCVDGDVSGVIIRRIEFQRGEVRLVGVGDRG